ncbi:GATA zinc finger domain-containing protein 14 [Condylostylus longicornis]|uniref:GATA zinc finger domain-containing protein 14 n=1 Tax=Condylostylus longicornis TaxID=2530218 RepID=UPI00244E55A9|nr:GATA zinc finger domain-containing protein 14 [Condylostylus longicornis]XP_055390466.1 GATA zinc finger domain-containing protein 14 [Condylostylus longicornis]
MQVKKARTESARKPIVPPPQSSLPENITVRTQSKTKVSTGSRRNNIIGYVPRVNRQEVVAPPLTNILTGNPNNGAATLPSIPLIDDDVIPCFNGGLPILDLQNGRTSEKKLNGVESKSGKNTLSKSSSPLQQSTYNKNGLPSLLPSTTTTTTTIPTVSSSSSTTHSRQPNQKSSFNTLSSKKDKSNDLSKTKAKDNKKKFEQQNDNIVNSISSSKKEKKSTQQKINSNLNNGLPNLIDDEFGFGRSLLSESSDDDEAEDESCKQEISYNEFGLPILTSKNNNNNNNNNINNKNSGSNAFNYPETNNNERNSFESGSSTSMINNGYSNGYKNDISQSKSNYNIKEKKFSNVKNTNNNYNNNNNNININSNVKHEPVITKESNFRNELNFNKETFTAQKRQLNKFPIQQQDQELPTKMRKKDDSNHIHNENISEMKKDKKDKKNKKDKKEKKDKKGEKEKKNKYSNNELGNQDHSLTSNLHKVNNQNMEPLSKYNKSFSPLELNEKSRTNFSTSDSLNSSYNNSNSKPNYPVNNFSNNINKSLPDLTIVIDDDDDDDDFNENRAYNQYNHDNKQIVNNEKISQKSSNFNHNNASDFFGLPDLSCAINNNEINDNNKSFDNFTSSSSLSPSSSFLSKQTKPISAANYNINSINRNNNFQDFEKSKLKMQKGQPNYQDYNQQDYYNLQSHQLQQQKFNNCQQDYKENFVNIFNAENVNSNLNENQNYIKDTFDLNKKIENHFNTESNCGYYDKLNLNRDNTNKYIGLEAIKSDDHLNSRGTSESEVGILSSSDSSSSDSDSSSSDSDSDDESRKRHSNKNKKSYQNTTNFQQQEQEQYGINNFQSSTTYHNNNNNNNNNSNSSNYKYQQSYNRNSYNNNSNINNVAFLHNDLKLSESDSSDSEL